jgi:diaminohydroxyphosphoribosylaminopyrimidine deaminase/5-amino-6-(5-phosphoribosylamino)uracil reductase
MIVQRKGEFRFLPIHNIKTILFRKGRKFMNIVVHSANIHKFAFMTDADYMRRCFSLAERGMNNVSPNPRVGAIVVVDDWIYGTGSSGLGNGIIGEGWHRQYGEAHAEVNAITDVRKRYGFIAKELLRRSTVYVNLEPCSHHGKTPPCADLIIKCGIPRVVVSCLDPNPHVNGAGVERLRTAGVEVVTGILEKDGLFLNRRFISRITSGRPYIILKWAQSADGFIAPANMQPLQGGFRLTGEETQIEDHKLRASEDAVMVGTNTLLMDDPQLNIRMFKDKGGKNPLRISLDLHDRLPDTLHFFDNSQPTLLFTSKNINIQKPVLPQVIEQLNERELNSLTVEGGAALLNSFIKESLYDEVRIYTAPVRLGDGLKAPALPNDVEIIEEKISGHDKIMQYVRKNILNKVF